MGKSQELLDPAGIAQARDVWTRVALNISAGRILVAINQEYADLESRVEDGDEVAFFPPVTGG